MYSNRGIYKKWDQRWKIKSMFKKNTYNIFQRVLYTANVGDARAILSRKNIASRLSYDHKGSDPVESRRIVETGGFMMNHRVNGNLFQNNTYYLYLRRFSSNSIFGWRIDERMGNWSALHNRNSFNRIWYHLNYRMWWGIYCIYISFLLIYYLDMGCLSRSRCYRLDQRNQGSTRMCRLPCWLCLRQPLHR